MPTHLNASQAPRFSLTWASPSLGQLIDRLCALATQNLRDSSYKRLRCRSNAKEQSTSCLNSINPSRLSLWKS
jgi:hypothetical protein